MDLFYARALKLETSTKQKYWIGSQYFFPRNIPIIMEIAATAIMNRKAMIPEGSLGARNA